MVFAGMLWPGHKKAVAGNRLLQGQSSGLRCKHHHKPVGSPGLKGYSTTGPG